MTKKNSWSYLLIILACLFIYREFVVFGKTPLPADTLVGAYFPWLDFKWDYEVGVPVKNALTSDAFSQFYVWKMKIVDIYKSGHVPLWNKYSFSGTPLLSTFHSSVFNPANIFLFIPKIGWGLYILLSTVFAALSMNLFLGLYTKNWTARVVGSLIFSLSGPMTTWAEFGTAVWAAGFMPIILYLIYRYIKENNYRLLFPLSISIGVLIFCGHVQMLIYTAVISLFFSVRQIDFKKDIWVNKATWLFISCLLGLGIGAIQLLPSLKFFDYSIRSEEKYSSSFNYGLSPLREIVRFLAADFYGHPSRGNHFSEVSYHEYSSYFGVFTIPLLIYLLQRKKTNSVTRFFALVFMVGTFLAFDHPVSRWVFSLPIPLLTYSSASRLFFVTGFAAAFLASMALVIYLKEKKQKRHLSSAVFITMVFIPLFLIFVDKEHFRVSLRNLIYYEALLSAVFLMSFFVTKRILVYAIMILTILDLSRYFNKYNTFVDPKLVFPETPITKFLRAQDSPFRIIRENVNIVPANTWMYYNLESIEGYDPLYSLDYSRLFHLANKHEYTNGVSRYALLENIQPNYLSALNVRYLLSVNPKPGESDSGMYYEAKKSGFKEVFRDGRVRIMENPEALERAYFMGKVIPAESKGDMFDLMSDADFDPRTQAVVLGSVAESLYPRLGKIINTEHLDNQVKIRTSTDSPGFITLADNYDPGWKLKINGQVEKIYQVNGSLMGAFVPSGESQLDFYYLPDEYIFGLKISLASVLVAISIYLYFILRP